MIKSIAVCVLVMGLALGACDKGTLKCNNKSEALICDSSNKYYLSGTSCAVSTQTNCQIISLTGDCTLCAAGFYLDGNTKKCVAVDTTKVVNNCLSYGTSQACVKCIKAFFISSGKCAAVTKTVDNCEFYSDDGK